MSGRWMPLVLVLWSVVGTRAECTNEELDLLFECIIPHNNNFGEAIGLGSFCNRSRITNEICTEFATIVDCVNKQDVSRTTCRPYAIEQINPKMGIPCKIKDFEDVCTNAPAIDKGTDGATSAGKTSNAHISLILTSSFTTVILAAVLKLIAATS